MELCRPAPQRRSVSPLNRTPGDEGSYPDDDLQAVLVEGKWKFVHKDGTPYS